MARTAGKVVVAMGLVLAGLAGAEPAAFGGESQVPVKGLTLLVRVDNSAHVPATILAAAREVAERVFHDIGVELIWLEQDDRRSGDVDGCGSCVTVHLLTREMTHLMGTPEPVLGIAEGTAVAVVFYNRIARLSRTRNDKDTACMLGHVMAHEIGHLLLGKGHSHSGIMQAALTPLLVAQGGLFFTAIQAHVIRTKLGAS
jgi:hypothetical protein